MHELSVAEALLDTLSAWQREHGGNVIRVLVKAGRLAGIDPEALRFAWPMAMEHAPAGVAGCELEVVMLPLTLCCAVCGGTTECERLVLTCPACGENALRRRGGRELLIQHIEVEHV